MEMKIKDLEELRKKIISQIKLVYKVKFKADPEEFYSELLSLESAVNNCFGDFVDKK